MNVTMRTEFYVWATGLLFILINIVSSMSPRVVDTTKGRLKGFIVTPPGRHFKPVEVYLGVPYARAPVADFRYLPPVSSPPWDGVRKATKMPPACPQTLPDIRNETAALETMPRGRLEYLKKLLPYLQDQSEDCLFLNIYAPYQG